VALPPLSTAGELPTMASPDYAPCSRAASTRPPCTGTRRWHGPTAALLCDRLTFDSPPRPIYTGYIG